MTEVLVLDTVGGLLDELPGGQALLAVSSTLDLQWLPGGQVRDVVVRHEPPDALVAELAVLVDPVGALLTRAGPVALRLAPAADGPTTVLLRVVLGPSPALSVHDLPLALELDQPLLRRVDPVNGAPLAEPFRLEVTAAARIAADGTSDLELFGVSVPAFEIGRTGLILVLEDCQVGLDGAPAPLSLRDALAGEATFSGLHARRAVLRWLPQFRAPLGGGLALDFRDVAVEAAGVSFVLDRQWSVQRTGGRLGAGSEFLGRLFDDRVRLALERASGRLRHNRPEFLELAGWIELPSLGTLFAVRFGLVVDRDGVPATELTVTQDAALSLDLGVGTLSVTDLTLSGALDGTGFRVAGAARIGLNLPGCTIAPVAAEADLVSGPGGETLVATLPDIALGPLGRLRASVRVETTDDGVQAFEVQGRLTWGEVRGRLGLGPLPTQIPQPADDAELTATLAWRAGGGLTLRLEAAAGDPARAFDFLPAAFRPAVRSVAFGFVAEYADVDDFFAAAPGSAVTGTAYARIAFRPDLGGGYGGAVTLRTGDADGYVDARLFATVGTTGSGQLRLELTDPVGLELGLPGVTDGPLLEAALTAATLTLDAGGTGPSTLEIGLTGSVQVRPAAVQVPPSLLGPLSAVLDPLTTGGLRGTVEAVLRLREDRAAVEVTARLDDAGFRYDLGDLIGQLAHGRAGPGTGTPGAEANLAVGLALESIVTRLGQLDGAADPAASVEVRLLGTLGGAEILAFARLSTTEFVIGVESGEIPLRLPPFPLGPADLAAVTGPAGDWTTARFSDRLGSWSGPRRQLAAFVRDRWLELPPDARRTYQYAVTAAVAVLDGASALTRTTSDVRLVVGPAQLRVPFADPRGIAVEGGARLVGFAADDPLRALEGTSLALGLSADQVYFELTGSGQPIPLPAFGHYRDGSVSLSEVTVGYGFTRNSLAVALAGELVWPDGLTEDADTSELIGFGVKLPQHNRISFRLDLIPVPGPIPVVPLLEFAVDLRTPGVPAIADTQVVRPAWDGLQLTVPGVIRADLKQLALSPVLGVLPVANLRYDGDLQLGDDTTGVTVVVDDLVVLAGLGTPPTNLTVPFLIDPAAPYFEHVGLNARLAGFAVNLTVQRPLPLPNPLLVFDVLALIADPLRPLDPASPLARLLRVTVTDTYVTIPAWARPFIPGAPELVRQELNAELNLGSVIGVVQWLARVGLAAVEVAEQALAAGQAAVTALGRNPPTLAVGELLDLLPPELRSVDCGLNLGGFDAAATVILAESTDVTHPALARFDAADRSAVPASGAPSVLVAARIDLLGGVTYRMLGRLGADGSFALVSRLGVEPLRLRIAGLTLDLPLQLSARLVLRGEVSGRRRHAELSAQGTATWDVVPGVLRVRVGTAAHPVELRLDSRGRFRISGDGVVTLAGASGLRIEGRLEASEAHLAVEGRLDLALGSALRIEIDGACRVGPGPRWAFEGRGRLVLFDLDIVDVEATLRGFEVAVRAAVPRRRWRLGALPEAHVSGELSGRLEAATGRAALAGRGRLELLGAVLDGALDVRVDATRTRVRAEGALTWQGRTWLAAAVTASSDGTASISGRTSVVLDVTPSELPAGIQVASLFLRAELGGRLSFGGPSLAGVQLDVDWSLGVRLPGAPPGQLFVLAMQKMSVSAAASLDHVLIDVQGLSFVPLDDIVIPVPVIRSTGQADVYRVKVNIPLLDQVRFMATDDIIDFVEDTFGDDLIGAKLKLFSIPKDLSIELEDRPLSELTAALAFRVSLRWAGGQLGFALSRGRQTQFFPLSDLT